MKTVKIQLVSLNDVKEFVSKTNGLPCEADLNSGRYSVDAKSIMGIFSLDLSKPIEFTIHSDNCEEFLQEISQFIVD